MGHTTTATSAVPIEGYCSYTDIENSIEDLAGLAAKSAPTGSTAEEWVAAQTVFADNEINGRLGGKYLVPFSTPYDPLIVEISRLLTVHHCLNPNFVGAIPADSKLVDTPYNRADKLLTRIEDGEILLAGETPATDPMGDIVVSSESAGREFTQSKYDSSGNMLSLGSMEGI